MRVTIAAPAKINLFLEITGRRNDGYHIIDTVMQTVSLFDDITVTYDEDGSGIKLSCTDDEIPCDSTNTAYKAAEAFFEATGAKTGGVTIKIKKRIPSGAGLAGGSADAAGVLVALNELTDSGLDTESLAEIGEKIGADVPFCICSSTMSASGIGTILSPLPDMPGCSIVIIKPDFKISTKQAYETSDKLGYDNIRTGDKMVNAVCNGSLREISCNLYNKFEDVADEAEIELIKNELMEAGAEGALMTGSGSAVFGIFEDEDCAEDCRNMMSKKYDCVYLVYPEASGPRQISSGGLFGAIFD